MDYSRRAAQFSKLIASCDRVGQFFDFAAELRPGPGLDDLGKTGQDAGIDGVCFGRFSDSAGELTYLFWQSDCDFEIGFEQSGNYWAFITAGCFEYDQFNIICFDVFGSAYREKEQMFELARLSVRTDRRPQPGES